MDKKKTLKAVFSVVVIASILIGAGAVYSTHIYGTLALMGVAFIYANQQIKSLGK